jgi:hypothetical protein
MYPYNLTIDDFVKVGGVDPERLAAFQLMPV